MKLFLPRIVVLTTALSISLMACSEQPQANNEADAKVDLANQVPIELIGKIERKIAIATNGIQVEGVKATEADGVYEVTLDNGQIVYSLEDAEYFFQGSLLHLTDQGVVNVTVAAENKLRAAKLAMIDEKGMIVFPAQGEQRGVINVFTDIDCGYCRRLHNEVPRLNELGVTVRYMAYPRAGIMRNKEFTESFKKLKSVWCDDNPLEAMTKAKQTGFIKDNLNCQAPIAEQYQLGRELGVTATPTIILENGRSIPGYRPAEQILQTVLSES